MPGTKHVKGVGPKEQREYEHIKESAEKSGRYGDRAAEVAARTVLKQHKEKRDTGKDSKALILPLVLCGGRNPVARAQGKVFRVLRNSRPLFDVGPEGCPEPATSPSNDLT
jgi:hypothetical protein